MSMFILLRAQTLIHHIHYFRQLLFSTSLLAMLGYLAMMGLVRAEDVTLTILYTNDTHARIDPVTMDGSRCRLVDATAHQCYGGFARLSTEIRRLRSTEPHPILVDAGDRFQGSLYYTYYKSSVLKPFYELLGYQAMTIGNHEFDDGPGELARFLDGFTVPVISANIDARAEPTLAGRFGGTTVLPVEGGRIGLIGLTTPFTATNSKPGPNVHFTDPVEAARIAVTALHAQGINRILVLSHLGLGEDETLAAKVDGVSVIVGGHTHLLLRENDRLAVKSSPDVVMSPSGRPVLVVQAYFAGIYLGRLQVTLNDAGVPVRWQGQPVLLDDTIAEDPVVRGFAAALAQPLAAEIGQVIGVAKGPLSGTRAECRFSECALGNLIADAMREQTRNEGIQVAIMNGGGIRTGLPAGPISMGQVLEVLPFANTISTFMLKGSDLRAAIEHGLSRAESATNDGTGRFPQVSGLRIRWDASAPAGQRVISLQVQGSDGGLADLNPDMVYHVATIDFLRAGGDGYAVFKNKAINPYDGGALLSDALVAAVQLRGSIEPRIDGRIVREH